MKKRLITAILVTAGVLLLLAGYFFFVKYTGKGIPCLFETVTHLKCPGCGSTRACLAYSRLDFAEGLKLNYLLPFEAAYIGAIAAERAALYVKYGDRKKKNAGMPLWVHIAALAVIILWWIVRNIVNV